MERKGPPVGVIMGSDSDLPVMESALDVLEELGIDSELKFMSAHRTPETTRKYAIGASRRGIQIIIAGAGGAAQLPGVIASWTELPVIGVPIAQEWFDPDVALKSMTDLPEGVPVATVGVNRARNGGLLAARILALNDKVIRSNLERLTRAGAVLAEDKNNKLKRIGAKAYLGQMLQ